MLLAAVFYDWFPWAVMVIALAALVALAVRFGLMYRNMKREKLELDSTASKSEALLDIDGEYFVLRAMCPYGVGEGKPLRAAKYEIGTDSEVALQINGLVADYGDGEYIELREGDSVRAERDVRVRIVE